MRFRLSAVLAALGLFGAALAPPLARADNYAVRDGNGQPQTMASKSAAGVNVPVHICAVWVSGNWVLCNGDGSGNLGVNIQNTPTVNLGTIAGAALESGHIASVDTKTPGLGQTTKSGSSPVALPSDPDPAIVTGTITAADSATGTVAGQGGVTLITGTPTTNSYLDVPINGVSEVTITATGTFSGSLNIEASGDAATFAPAGGKIRGSSSTPAPVTTITGAGIFRVDTAGMTDIRVRAATFASGTATLKFKPTMAPGVVEQVAGQRIIDANGNQATIKAASTPASTADTALVVAPIVGSSGQDFSANNPTLPNIGANFGASGPYANYILIKTIAASVTRANADIENLSGDQIVVVRDDGTAANAAAPVNASAFALAPGAAAGAQGGSWSSTTFKGRIQIYGPSASDQVAAFVD